MARIESALNADICAVEGRAAKQSLAFLAPIVDVVLAGQGAQTKGLEVSDEFAPGSPYLPAGHKTEPEQEGEVRPLVEPNTPTGQVVHARAPRSEYVPGAQIPEQFTPNVPGAH